MKHRSMLKAASLLAFSGILSSFSAGTAAYAEPFAPPPPHQGINLTFMTEGSAHAKPTKLTIEFMARTENTSPTSAQLKLNQLVDDVSKALSGEDDIKIIVGNYSISQQYTQKGPEKWNAQQSIKISGTDSRKLLSSAEKLQKIGLNIDNMAWSLDAQTRQKLEQKARTEALKKVQAQAESDAHDLGLKFVKLETIMVHTGGMPGPMLPRPGVMMLSRSVETAPPPQSTPEDQSVTVTVTAAARLDNP